MSYSILTDQGTRLEIEIRRKPSYNIVIFTGICVVASIAIIWPALQQLIAYPFLLSEARVIFLVVLFIAGLYMLKLLLWNLRGKEKVVVNEKELIIRKLGTILSVVRRYELSFVTNFTATKHSPYPWWMKVFGIAGGQVEFHYLGTPRYFGQTLQLAQAQEIASLVSTRIAHLYLQHQTEAPKQEGFE